MGCYSNHLPRKIIKDHVLIFTPLCKHVLLLWILFVYILSFCAHFILFNGSIVLHYFFPPPLDLFITSYIYIYIYQYKIHSNRIFNFNRYWPKHLKHRGYRFGLHTNTKFSGQSRTVFKTLSLPSTEKKNKN